MLFQVLELVLIEHKLEELLSGKVNMLEGLFGNLKMNFTEKQVETAKAALGRFKINNQPNQLN